MSMPSLPSGGTEKSWISKPENRTTAIFLVLAGISGFMLWGAILPFILAVLDGTLVAMWHAAVIVGIFWAVTSKRIHKMARVINRWITGWFVSLDPIGIREDHISQTKKRQEKAGEAIGSVRGLRDNQSRRMAVNKAEYAKTSGRLRAAQTVIASPASYSAANLSEAQRSLLRDAPYAKDLEDTIASQEATLAHYDDSIKKLTRLMEMCDDIIARLQNEIRLQRDHQEEAKALRTVRGAMASLFGRGTSADDEMDDMAREMLEQQYSAEIGAFDQYLEEISGAIAKSDFNNLAAVQEAQGRMAKANAEPMPTVRMTPALSAPPQSMSISVSKDPVVSEYFK